MSLKVIGAGFGRTGTTSLKAALETLGFDKCYHMFEVQADPGKVQYWTDAADKKTVNWDTVFSGYQASVDWPACTFYQQQAKQYPDAKIILSIRDEDSWYRSTLETIYKISEAMPAWLCWLSPTARAMQEMVYKVVWDGTFHGRFEDEAYAKTIYRQHIADVKAATPPEQLLVFNVKEGWRPLCDFLGVDPPANTEFPHLNDADEIKKIGQRLELVSWLVPCVVVTGLAALIVFGFSL